MAGIYASKLESALREGLPLCVLLWGDEAGAIRHAAQTVQTAVCAATGLDMADPFAAETLSLTDLADEPSRLTDSALTLSFTSPHKLITLKGVSGSERADDIKTLTEAVKALLDRAGAGVTVVLPVPGHLDKKHALVKLVEGHEAGLSVRFFSDSARDLETFLKSEITRLGSAINPSALALLVSGLGADREVARREVEKLVVYAGSETPISEDHVRASLCGATPAGVFLLAEAVLARNCAHADLLLHQLTEQGEDLNGAFMMVLGELKKVALAHELRQQGESDDIILAKCGKAVLPPPAKQAFLQATRRYPPARLAQVPERALEALTLARSGLLPAEHVLGRALLGWAV